MGGGGVGVGCAVGDGCAAFVGDGLGAGVLAGIGVFWEPLVAPGAGVFPCVLVGPEVGTLAICVWASFMLCAKWAKLMPPTASTPATAPPVAISVTNRLRSCWTG